MKIKNLFKTALICLLLVNLTVCLYGQTKETSSLERRIINPWTWQDGRGFVQSNEITGAKRTLYTAGIVSVDADGKLLHPQDMEKQMATVMDNMETLLNQAGFELSDVVRFTYYTTSVKDFTVAAQSFLVDRLTKANCRPATTLIGITELFHPDCVIEIEAVVVD